MDTDKIIGQVELFGVENFVDAFFRSPTPDGKIFVEGLGEVSKVKNLLEGSSFATLKGTFKINDSFYIISFADNLIFEGNVYHAEKIKTVLNITDIKKVEPQQVTVYG